jgi:hypothetical protein
MDAYTAGDEVGEMGKGVSSCYVPVIDFPGVGFW